MFEKKVEAETKEQAEKIVREMLLNKFKTTSKEVLEFSICPIHSLSPDKPFKIKNI